jgi:hypothetical protein
LINKYNNDNELYELDNNSTIKTNYNINKDILINNKIYKNILLKFKESYIDKIKEEPIKKIDNKNDIKIFLHNNYFASIPLILYDNFYESIIKNLVNDNIKKLLY